MANLALINNWNRAAPENRRSLSRKALDSSVGAGDAPYSPLVPQHLERIITNTILRLSPEMALVELEYAPQKYHEFDRLTALPRFVGPMGEMGVTQESHGAYDRKSIELKIIRGKMRVSNFLQDTSKGFIDAVNAESENGLQSHIYNLITMLYFGNAAANKYAFDGLDRHIATNRLNNAQGGVVPTSLAFLDDLIDANMTRQGFNHKKVFVMTPKMQSLVSRLLTNVYKQQTSVEVDGGWRMMTYRDIPILVTSALIPQPVLPLGSSDPVPKMTVTGTGNGKFARVSAINWDGECLASDAVACATGLAWTPIEGAHLYKIYGGTNADVCKLVAVVPAWTYDSAGTPVARVAGVDITGDISMLNPAMMLVAPAGILDGPTTSVTTAMAADIPKVATGGVIPEDVLLWDLDKYQGLGKVVYTNQGGDKFQGLVTLEPLARDDDNIPFLIKSYLASIPSYEGTSAISKGWRTA
jgi:hypothetical protein